ncbi:MAG: hypothetical protein HUK25_03835 [Treponema sp.]|nr:hypothetical protein [Treponema sp.]
MEYLLIGILSAVIVALLAGLYRYLTKPKESAVKKKKKVNTGATFARCPLCDMPLPIGDNIFTKVYRPMDVPDQRCIVMGCIHCYPKVESGLKRICPVCHKEVPLSGNLIARLFNKKDGSKHVHIVCCTECSK